MKTKKSNSEIFKKWYNSTGRKVRREYWKKYYQANKEYIKQQRLKRYYENKDKINPQTLIRNRIDRMAKSLVFKSAKQT